MLLFFVAKIRFSVRIAARYDVVILATPIPHVPVHLLVEGVVQSLVAADVALQLLERRRRLQLQRLCSFANKVRQSRARIREHSLIGSTLLKHLQHDTITHDKRCCVVLQ